MGIYQLIFVVVTFLSLLSSGYAIKCLECNVWKAGYGHKCDKPRVRDGCTVCMKTETTIYMGYYKNVPRSSLITTLICGKSKSIRHHNECTNKELPDGNVVRCYCDDKDLCNAATPTTLRGHSSWHCLFLAIAAVVLNYCLRQRWH